MTGIEILEGRKLFAADPMFTLTSKGTLIIHGTAGHDGITVDLRRSKPEMGFRVFVTPSTLVPFQGLATDHGTHLSFNSVKRIMIDGGAGDDDIFVAEPKITQPVTILGGDGNDRIRFRCNGKVLADGGAGNDTIGESGGIRIFNRRNRDVLNEHFKGVQRGPNTLLGGDGDDTLAGNIGDSVDGGAGNDKGVITCFNFLATSVSDARADALAHDFYARLGAVGLEQFGLNH